jgi:hypothetical protein
MPSGKKTIDARGKQPFFVVSLLVSRHHNGVARLELYVLLRVAAFDYFLVVEGQPCLGPARIPSKYVYRLSFGKITEATTQCYCVQYRCRVSEHIGSRMRNLTEDLKRLLRTSCTITVTTGSEM